MSEEKRYWRGMFVYEPIDWKKKLGDKVYLDQCRAAVHESGRGVDFYQCQRKPVETVDGFGFCRQHFKFTQPEVKA